MSYKDYKLFLIISCYAALFGVSAIACVLGLMSNNIFGGGHSDRLALAFTVIAGLVVPIIAILFFSYKIFTQNKITHAKAGLRNRRGSS